VRRRIFRLALVLFALAHIAATCKGTETGNPGVPSDNPSGGGTSGGTGTGGVGGCPAALKSQAAGSDQVVDDLIQTLCNKIILCGIPTTAEACLNALNGEDGDRMTDEFGLPEGAFTIVELRQALIGGQLTPNDSAVSSCETAIGSEYCSIVTANVSENDFSGTENIVPSSCAAVFPVNPEVAAPCP
jgi:hypothetical protein